MTLETLLDRALVSKWNRGTWFRTARLVQNSLLVSDLDDAQGIERQFLPRLREHFPGLVVTFAKPAEKASEPAKPRPSAFKKAWHGELGPQATQADLYRG